MKGLKDSWEKYTKTLQKEIRFDFQILRKNCYCFDFQAETKTRPISQSKVTILSREIQFFMKVSILTNFNFGAKNWMDF